MSDANQAAVNPVAPQVAAGQVPEETKQVEQQDAGFERASWSEFGFEERPDHVPVGAGEGGVGFAEAGKSLAVSPYCLDVDQWCARRGVELCGEFGEMIPTEAEAVQTAMGDFFAAAFEPSPVLRPANGCVDQARHQFLASLLETPEYHALHARTNFDSEASELACGSFAQAYGVIVAELTKAAPAGQTPEQRAKNEFRKQMKIMSAVSQGINQASQQVSNYEDACNAFGSGKGPGGQMDTKAMAGLFKRIRDNDALARICQLAGRYRRKAQSMQRRKVVHGRDDMVGTALSGDIARVVPSELVAFNDPDLEVVALAKLAEKGLLSREYRGIEKVAAGPLMIYLDECMHPDELVSMASGEIKRIDDVVVGDEVVSVDWTTGNIVKQVVGRTAKVESKPIHVVSTPEGELRCSGIHAFFVLRDGNVYEVKAQDLQPGDLIAAPRKIPHGSRGVCQEDDLAFAQCLGYMLGDGDKWHDKKANSKRIQVTDKDVKNLELYANLFHLSGFDSLLRKWGGKNRLCINSAKLYDLVEMCYPTLLVRSPKRSIPAAVTMWPTAKLAKFVRGLFDAESNVGDHQITITMSSKAVIDVLQLLLKRFGIVSERDMRPSGFVDHDYHRLIISDRDSLNVFSSRIGFGSDAKSQELQRVLSRGRKMRSRSRRINISLRELVRVGRSIGLRFGAGDWQWVQATNVVSAPRVRRLIQLIEHQMDFIEEMDWSEWNRELLTDAGLSRADVVRGTGLGLKQVRHAISRPLCDRREQIMSWAQSEMKMRVSAARDAIAKVKVICNPQIYWTEIKGVSISKEVVPYLRDLTMQDGSPNYVAGNLIVHNSGSMHGEPSYHAKSFALAMAWIAQHQNRWCCLVAFSGSCAIDDLRIMVLEPNRWKQEDLFQWLEQFEGGGTTIDWLHGNVLSQLFAKTGAEQGKTDVVVVSDAEVRTNDAVIGSCLEWKKANQAKVISIVLGTNNAGDLGRVSDKVFLANHLDVESDAVAEAFSI